MKNLYDDMCVNMMLRVKNNLGNKIKEYRKKIKITQQTLANMFEVNIETIKVNNKRNKGMIQCKEYIVCNCIMKLRLKDKIYFNLLRSCYI